MRAVPILCSSTPPREAQSPTSILAMAELRPNAPAYDDEKHLSDTSSDEKKLDDHAVSEVDDRQMTKEVEAMEDRIANDEATDAEYRVEEAYEVAIKVVSAPSFRTHELIPLSRSSRRGTTPSCRP